MKRFLFAVAATVSCASAPHPTQVAASCIGFRGAPIAALDSSQLAMLVGRFRMVEMNMADSAKGKIYTNSYALELHSPNAAERAQIKRRSANSPEIHLVGTNKSLSDDQSEYVEVHDAFIVLGCADCYDGRATLLQIQHLDSEGFQGTWRVGQGGNFRLMQTSENAVPEPSGRFCSERVASDIKR